MGYGDVYPITMGGKIFTFFILMIGVGIVPIPAGLVASALTHAREIEEEEDRALEEAKRKEADAQHAAQEISEDSGTVATSK